MPYITKVLLNSRRYQTGLPALLVRALGTKAGGALVWSWVGGGNFTVRAVAPTKKGGDRARSKDTS